MNSNREILFRGFHPCEDGDTTIYVEGKAVKGRWVYGDLLHWYNTDENKKFTCIIPNEYGADGSINIRDLIVLPSTVCQYTGLTDKNGKRIFESDIILEKGTGYKAAIEWQLDTCRFLAFITNRRDERSPHFFYVDKWNDRDCQMSSNEVTGTIWDKEV